MTLTFGDIYGDPNMVGSSEHRAIAETIADCTDAGTGIPGDWDPSAKLENIPLQRAILEAFIDTARSFLEDLSKNDEQGTTDEVA